jgi:aryl-alcohol dehydrogenase-like predicted oxidoreductase
MHKNTFGSTGLLTSALGFGAGQIGGDSMDEGHIGYLLNAGLDMGINLIDTARGYGLSEARIGRHLNHRRGDFVLSTKVGYGIEGHADWSPGIIEAGIDTALRTMRTDVIDIVHLHSCPVDVLEAGDVTQALVRMREKGKIRVAAYSGDNEALAWAVRNSQLFGSVECSVNPFDQFNLHSTLPNAKLAGQGVIAKRALGNAPWRFAQQPVGNYCETYWLRMQTLALETAGLPWDEFALRFTAFAPGVSCAIVGTTSVENLRKNVGFVEKGDLPAEVRQAVVSRWAAAGAEWRSEI